MEKEKIIKNIKRNMLENPNGFTLNKNGEMLNLNKGYAVSITNNINNDSDRLIEDLFKLVKKHKVKFYAIGGWFDNDSRNFYLDITLITNKLSRAIGLGLKHNQKALFSFEDLRCINLN